MPKNDQKVETAGRELVLTRTFDAPRDLVLLAYSTCEHLSKCERKEPLGAFYVTEKDLRPLLEEGGF